MTKRFQQTHNGDHSHGQGVDGDPLAELARLIGQTDPRSSFGRSNAVATNSRVAHAPSHDLESEEPTLASEAPPWVRTANVSRQQADENTYHHASGPAAGPAWSSQFQHDDEPQLSPTPSFLARARQQPQPAVDESRYDHVLYGQEQSQSYSQQPAYAQHDYAAQTDDYESYAPPMKKKRSNFVTVGAVVALGILGTASAFAYRTYGGAHRSGEPPVIKADAGAIKVVPPTSEGSAKPINDRFASAEPGKERLVPREEKPIDVTSGTAPRVVFPPLNQQPAAGMPPQSATVRPNVAQANASVQPDEPRKVRTVSVRPDQPDTSPVQQRPAAPPPAPSAVVPSTQRVAAPAAPAPSANAPMSLSPQATNNAPIRTAAVAPAPGGGSYLIQIASQRTEADALASYRVAQSKFPSLLGSRNPLIRKADLGEKGMYYRALVGPFASAEEASQLCGSMRSAGGQCVIHRN